MGRKSLDSTEVLGGDKSSSSENRATLVMIKGSNPGQEFTLGERTTIGREADITIADTAASREHAEVVQASGEWKVNDLGSTNGTELNGSPLTSQQPIQHGDKITIGRTVLQFIQDAIDPDTGEVYHLEIDE